MEEVGRVNSIEGVEDLERSAAREGRREMAGVPSGVRPCADNLGGF